VLLPIATPWIIFLLSLLIFSIIGKRLHWEQATIGGLILTAGFGNTSFLGFPLLEALYGKGALQTAILVDQPGSFLALSTIGIAVAAYYSPIKKEGSPSTFKRIISFPPFLASVIGIALNGIAFPARIDLLLERLGSTLIPLALVSIGYQLHFPVKGARQRLKEIGLGLSYKLLLAPAVILLITNIVFATGIERKIIVLEAGMAPMITAAIVAQEYELDKELIELMLMIGIPLSFVTLLIWYFLLR